MTPDPTVVHLADRFQDLPDAHAIVKCSSTKTTKDIADPPHP
jgi:hypothetical protein